jgi:uncharacterized protein (DUF1697 family)
LKQIKVLLLRGVNVSGANRLPMPEFREMLAEQGVQDVQTHIQSGNAVFRDPGVPDLMGKVAAAMLNRFGFAPAMFLMDLAGYEAILRANPYAAQGGVDGAKVHIYFLSEPAPKTDLAALRALAVGGEAVTLTDKALYLLAPNGIGRSVLAERLDRHIPVKITARNQRSAESIAALARSIAAA